MAYSKIILVLALSQICFVGSLNILGIVSLPLKSHYMFFDSMFHELSFKGHSVTIINNYPESDPPRNLSYININADEAHGILPMSEYEKSTPWLNALFNFYVHFKIGRKIVRTDCENYFIKEEMKKFREKKEKFDVIFVEQFLSDCGLVYAAVFHDAPIIGIASHTLLPWGYPRLGIPFDIGTDAYYFSDAGSNPSLYKKVENYLMDFYSTNIGRWQLNAQISQVFKKHVPNVIVDVEKIAKERIIMMFLNQHYSITGARLLPPRVLEIGGIHIKKTKPVPDVSTCKIKFCIKYLHVFLLIGGRI